MSDCLCAAPRVSKMCGAVRLRMRRRISVSPNLKEAPSSSDWLDIFLFVDTPKNFEFPAWVSRNANTSEQKANNKERRQAISDNKSAQVHGTFSSSQRARGTLCVPRGEWGAQRSARIARMVKKPPAFAVGADTFARSI